MSTNYFAADHSKAEPMPEGSRTPKRTSEEATRKKKKKPGQRVRVKEKVWRPRIWMWWVMILLLLQLIGFCTCQPPSGGWYYRRRLIDYLSITVIPFCRQLVSSLSLHLQMTIGPLCRQTVSSLSSYLWYHSRVTTNQALRIVLQCWTWGQGRDVRVDLLSYISYLRDLFRCGYLNYLLPMIFILYNGGSDAITLLRAQGPRAILPSVIVFSIPAFWKLFELKGQLARAKQTPNISINKTRLQSTSLWLVTKIAIIFIIMVPFLALVYWFKVVDREAFWEWADGAR